MVSDLRLRGGKEGKDKFNAPRDPRCSFVLYNPTNEGRIGEKGGLYHQKDGISVEDGQLALPLSGWGRRGCEWGAVGGIHYRRWGDILKV